MRARREDSSLHIPARPRCALKQLNSAEKDKDGCTCSKEIVAPVLPNYLRLPGSRRPQKGQLQGRSGPSFQELKQEECRWSLCQCLVMSIESGSSRRDVLSRINTRAEGQLWRRHLRQNISRSAVWLGQKHLTGADRRPGQDCPTSPSAKAPENERPSTHSPSLQGHGTARMW